MEQVNSLISFPMMFVLIGLAAIIFFLWDKAHHQSILIWHLREELKIREANLDTLKLEAKKLREDIGELRASLNQYLRTTRRP